MKSVILIWSFFLLLTASESQTSQDQFFMERLEDVVNGRPGVFEIARSGHSDALAFLKLYYKSSSRRELAEQLGLRYEISYKQRDRIVKPERAVILHLYAIAGDTKAFDELVAPIEEKRGDPNVPQELVVSRSRVLRDIARHKVNTDYAIEYIASLLFYPDGVPIITVDSVDFFNNPNVKIRIEAGDALSEMFDIPRLEELSDTQKTPGAISDVGYVQQYLKIIDNWIREYLSKRGIGLKYENGVEIFLKQSG